jgi:hypothetical protein
MNPFLFISVLRSTTLSDDDEYSISSFAQSYEDYQNECLEELRTCPPVPGRSKSYNTYITFGRVSICIPYKIAEQQIPDWPNRFVSLIDQSSIPEYLLRIRTELITLIDSVIVKRNQVFAAANVQNIRFLLIDDELSWSEIHKRRNSFKAFMMSCAEHQDLLHLCLEMATLELSLDSIPVRFKFLNFISDDHPWRFSLADALVDMHLSNSFSTV